MGPHQHVLHITLLVDTLRHIEAGDGAHLLEGGGGAARRGVGAQVLLAAGVLDTGRHVPVHVHHLFTGSEPITIEYVFAHGGGLGPRGCGTLICLKIVIICNCEVSNRQQNYLI